MVGQSSEMNGKWPHVTSDSAYVVLPAYISFASYVTIYHPISSWILSLHIALSPVTAYIKYSGYVHGCKYTGQENPFKEAYMSKHFLRSIPLTLHVCAS